MKINNKGFMLLETLIVAVFLVATLIFLYVQFNRVRSSYNISFTYNTSTNVYSSNTFLDYLQENGLTNMYGKLKQNKEQYMDLSSCDHIDLTNTEMCKSLVSNLGIKEIYLVSSDLIWIKQNIPASASNEMTRFINTLKEQDGVGSRLIVEFSDGTFASILARTDALPIIDSNELIDSFSFNDIIQNLTEIKHIVFEYDESLPINYQHDLSKEQNGKIIGIIEGDTYYIKSSGKVEVQHDASQLFSYSKVESIEFEFLPNGEPVFDTAEVTNMIGMFSSMDSLIQLDLSSFDTSKVTDMALMFSYSTNLEELNLSNFDTSKVINMDYMFSENNSLTILDLSSFDTSKVVSSLGPLTMFSGTNNIRIAYARTQDDADKLNSTSGKPSTYNFVVK